MSPVAPEASGLPAAPGRAVGSEAEDSAAAARVDSQGAEQQLDCVVGKQSLTAIADVVIPLRNLIPGQLRGQIRTLVC